MTKPTEHKTVQSRILQYAQDIGWTFVSRKDAEMRRNFDSSAGEPSEQARSASLFFDDLLYQKIKSFNPLYNEAEGALAGRLRRLTADIYGNRDMLTFLRNSGKYFSAEENRELDLMLIDYADGGRKVSERRNIYEVTEEFYWHNGRHGNREDIVFLINGIPLLFVETKAASKVEGMSEALEQVKRYHRECPELRSFLLFYRMTLFR